MKQATALIDGNNFYAACEQSIDPSLIGRPLVVLSNNDGCIVARSAEARKLGIKMGAPYFKTRHKLKKLDVMIRSSNYALYGDISQRLMSLLRNHCEQLEVYSIDEAFALISRPSCSNLRPWAQQLRALINQCLGLPISIGLGPNKEQAKLANYLAKNVPIHNGIFDLGTTPDIDTWLETIAIEHVWGIGKQLSRWCRMQGVNTARELRDMSSNELRAKCGVIGLRLQHELRGETCLSFSKCSVPKKETCVSRSFKRPISNLEELRQAIATYVVCASEKLRQQKQLTGAITIFISTNPFMAPFYKEAATNQLDVPSNDTSILLAIARTLTEQLFKPHHHLTKAGVLMQKLQSTNHVQQSLLVTSNEQEQEKRTRLMNTIDELNKRYGYGTVSWAACGLKQPWSMKRAQLSSSSTTRIKEVPIVNA